MNTSCSALTTRLGHLKCSAGNNVFLFVHYAQSWSFAMHPSSRRSVLYAFHLKRWDTGLTLSQQPSGTPACGDLTSPNKPTLTTIDLLHLWSTTHSINGGSTVTSIIRQTRAISLSSLLVRLLLRNLLSTKAQRPTLLVLKGEIFVKETIQLPIHQFLPFTVGCLYINLILILSSNYSNWIRRSHRMCSRDHL